MAPFLNSSDTDPPPSPKIENPVDTLDESSPTAPIRALVAHSLALSSPIRQIQNQPSSPAKPLTEIQNPDESSSSPSHKTLVTPPSVGIEESECRDSQIVPQSQISPDDNKILQTASTSYSLDANIDSYNRSPKRFISDFDYQSDDDLKIGSTKPGEFSWSSPKNEPTGVGAGLDNSGNTCFIASVLQCFTHTVPLIESLRSYKHQVPCNCGNEKFCVLQALREHIELALRSSGDSLRIDWFRDNLNYFSPDFQINNQEDAHEFLQSFLDKLERCCLDRRDKPGSVSSQDGNIVDHVFGGRLVSKLHCCNCNSISDTFEPSLGWSLEIEDVDNLSSALESFTHVEKLEDQFTCDNCKEKVSKEKQLKLDKLPLVATFHLKRFKNDGLFMEKIFKHVEFPLELDLLPYMSSNENPEVSTKYLLYAMVEHLGSGVSFGHYSSYVRSAPGTWHHFDDSKVRKISEEYVLSKHAYMLFYAREGTPWFSSAFEELKTLFEATPLNFSPKSVLETTCREECVSHHNAGNSNKACDDLPGVSIPGENNSDFRCDEPQEDVFHSAESSCDDDPFMFDTFESPKADGFEKPFAGTSQQEKPNVYPAGNIATIDEVASVPVLKTQEQASSPKRKADERATIGEAYRPKLKIQRQNSLPKRQGTFKIQRDHLQKKNSREETLKTKPSKRIVAADPREKDCALSYLSRISTHRSRMLAAAIDVSVKEKKVSNLKRPTMGLHRNLSEPAM
ncbi:hypothetical protein EUTSA_v10000790mg [Eutrema salsugineum]|uniref:Ubiquitin carboxyl-terminal hydrolase n=1 Tax=Eutrema salsugineum TaxID=72664 RepID=V4LBQ3_EUTSA|nr:ubiquitin carboxyl-terminal hydrolase 21 [Eutrema salsugineum]ESQ39822.1 hypothetical protein EUTSA_v10000790mg [Eutrema salsugineum]